MAIEGSMIQFQDIMGEKGECCGFLLFATSRRSALRVVIATIFLATSVMSLPVCSDESCILEAGARLIAEERLMSFSANVTLTPRERIVDLEVLGPMKYAEIQSRQLLPYMELPERELLSFIRRMPKGGNLHIHDIAMVDIRWVIENLTYLPDLYYCCYTTEIDEFLRFRFSDTPPERADFCHTDWFSVERKRTEIGTEAFDEMLFEKLTMKHVPRRHERDVWDEFTGSLIPIGDLKYSEPGFRLYFKQALTELYQDNVLYVEVRTLLDPLLCSNGSSYDEEHTLRQYISVAEEFKREHPDFIGVKIIFISVRSYPRDEIERDIRIAMDLYQRYPSDLAGYDLVGFENAGPPLRDLLDILLIPSQEGVELPFFFHAGETNRFGEHVDEDIVFAILLNTTRIAHAYSLVKHPKILELVKERHIPLEVCPLSNHVLALVDDVRNHPATILLANGLPVVINSDDPAAWHLSGLTNDYFATFMGFTRADDGLAFLKELSRQGIEYSAMNGDEKQEAFSIWQRKWDQFIDFYYDRFSGDECNSVGTSVPRLWLIVWLMSFLWFI